MTKMTLEMARAKAAELEAIIAELMTKAVVKINIDAVTIELREGEHYAGTALNEDGTVNHHLILMVDKPAEKMTWKDAKAYAKKMGGDLPTRQQASLIFANCKAHVEGAWHWTCEAHESNDSYAWVCLFDDGNQDDGFVSYGYSVRLVRRLNP